MFARPNALLVSCGNIEKNLKAQGPARTRFSTTLLISHMHIPLLAALGSAALTVITTMQCDSWYIGPCQSNRQIGSRPAINRLTARANHQTSIEMRMHFRYLSKVAKNDTPQDEATVYTVFNPRHIYFIPIFQHYEPPVISSFQKRLMTG
ncbi:hypothetical protein B0T13DRAFT_64377 [Neurospora crassa]|nr:hypothetical protein B0T13DRAFT_64377 [Neurospora crassa]